MCQDGTVILLMAHDTGVPHGAAVNRRVHPRSPPVSKSLWNRDPTRAVLATAVVWPVLFSLSDIPPSPFSHSIHLSRHGAYSVCFQWSSSPPLAHARTRRLSSRIEIESSPCLLSVILSRTLSFVHAMNSRPTLLQPLCF